MVDSVKSVFRAKATLSLAYKGKMEIWTWITKWVSTVYQYCFMDFSTMKQERKEGKIKQEEYYNDIYVNNASLSSSLGLLVFAWFWDYQITNFDKNLSMKLII